MNWYLVLMSCCIVISTLVSAYQIYKMVELDALSKGLKHPKFWGIFALSGANTSGLLLYLIGSRKYISMLSQSHQRIMNLRKKKACLSFGFLIAFIIVLMFILVTKY